MPGDSARTATSTSCRTANSRSAELTRCGPNAVAFRIAVGSAFHRRHHYRDRRTRENIIAWPYQKPYRGSMFGCPVGEPLIVKVLQIARVLNYR